jgi:hemerythrin superfamily protein
MLSKLLGDFPRVIQLLRDDHKLVRSLFAQYEKATNGKKPPLAQKLLRELTVHAYIEEKVLYPAFRRAFKEPQMIFEAFQEHHLVHLLINELSTFRPGPGSATFEAKMKVLKELVKHHVDEEERHVFPKAEAHDLDWDSLFERARKLKNHGLTTRSNKRLSSKSQHSRAA